MLIILCPRSSVARVVDCFDSGRICVGSGIGNWGPGNAQYRTIPIGKGLLAVGRATAAARDRRLSWRRGSSETAGSTVLLDGKEGRRRVC